LYVLIISYTAILSSLCDVFLLAAIYVVTFVCAIVYPLVEFVSLSPLEKQLITSMGFMVCIMSDFAVMFGPKVLMLMSGHDYNKHLEVVEIDKKSMAQDIVTGMRSTTSRMASIMRIGAVLDVSSGSFYSDEGRRRFGQKQGSSKIVTSEYQQNNMPSRKSSSKLPHVTSMKSLRTKSSKVNLCEMVDNSVHSYDGPLPFTAANTATSWANKTAVGQIDETKEDDVAAIPNGNKQSEDGRLRVYSVHQSDMKDI
jgi:hypothetical protein